MEAGGLLAVTGPNGAGKSSLLRLVAGLIRPAAGALAFVGRGEDDAVTHYVGHLDALKPALTLREMLLFWTRNYRGATPEDAEVEAAAETVGVGHALDLHTAVLSAGQRRRASLARLILAPRPLWLLDEPTSALDRDGEALVGQMMAEQLRRGGVILAATHLDLPVAPTASLALGGAS